jgi:bifunctional DNA-binding transcriptional regulator/antitoxin component of YhaV-PrlF toxin-antitoxin module
MTKTELVKMSPKGQLVVPQDIRETAHFQPGDRFISMPVKGGVLFKKVKINIQAEFKSLSKEIEAQFKKRSVSPKDVDEAVQWARKR